MMSNSDDLALPGSAHGYLGVRSASTPGEGGGLPVRPVRSRHLRARRTRNDPEARNPQSRPAHDASRSPPVGWDARRIGMGRRGGDKSYGHAARLFLRPTHCGLNRDGRRGRASSRVIGEVRYGSGMGCESGYSGTRSAAPAEMGYGPAVRIERAPGSCGHWAKPASSGQHRHSGLRPWGRPGMRAAIPADPAR
jgi:hypothetical protein